MRTIQVKLYQFDELGDDAKEKAREWYRNGTAAENLDGDDILSSIKGIFKASGIALNSFEFGPYSYSSVSFDMGDAGELTGSRAQTWLENNLLDGLRITREEFAKHRKDYLSYGPSYRAGKVKPCPFTGMCWDDDLLDALRASIKAGDTLKEAYHGLAEEARLMNERAIEYANEDEQVDDNIRANEYEFTEDGERA